MSETPFSTNENPTTPNERELRERIATAVSGRLNDAPELVSELIARGLPTSGELKAVLEKKPEPAPAQTDLQSVLDEVYTKLAAQLGAAELTLVQQTAVQGEIKKSFGKKIPTAEAVLADGGIKWLMVTWKRKLPQKTSAPLDTDALERRERVRTAVTGSLKTDPPKWSRP